jgi:hypothetical protein
LQFCVRVEIGFVCQEFELFAGLFGFFIRLLTRLFRVLGKSTLLFSGGNWLRFAKSTFFRALVPRPTPIPGFGGDCCADCAIPKSL